MASYPTAVTGESPNAIALEPACLRGPLRKPQQSGFGLWVGNLPSSIDIMMLKDHFSSETTDTIESVFLISRSNCAFVSYRTNSARLDALSRFHDSRFGAFDWRAVFKCPAGSPAPLSPLAPMNNLPLRPTKSLITRPRMKRAVCTAWSGRDENSVSPR